MTGIQYIKNGKGETTHFVADWQMYGQLIEKILDEIEDVRAFDEAKKSDEWHSLEEIRKIGLRKGIDEKDLKK